MKPVLVGEQNPYSGRPEDALLPWPRGASGDRLKRILGMSDRDYLRAFDRVDLVTGRGRRWSAEVLEEVAKPRALELLAAGAPLVLLGAKVAEAFGVPFDPFKRRKVRGVPVLLLPHPSGRNPAWLEAGAPGRARELVEELLAEDLPAAPGRNVLDSPEPPHDDPPEEPEAPGGPEPGATAAPRPDTPEEPAEAQERPRRSSRTRSRASSPGKPAGKGSRKASRRRSRS